LVAPAIFFAARKISSGHQTISHQDEIMVRLPPPPPPPKPRATPTPEDKPTPPPEQKMIEHPEVQEVKTEAPKEKPPDTLGSTIKGGPGGLAGLGTGTGEGSGYGNGKGNGSTYAWYGAKVQARIAEVVRNNPLTRKASINLVIRVWPDATGRITKARITGSTGDPKLDDTIQNDILTNLQMSDPPIRRRRTCRAPSSCA
jgi:outer membrane biosynthesis protein TonB